MQYRLTDAWRIPRLGDGTDLRPTVQRRDEIPADVSLRLADWWPNAMAWDILIRLHQVLDRRIKVTFSLPASRNGLGGFLPSLVAMCVGIHTRTIDGFPQPFLVVEDIARVGEADEANSAPYVIECDGVGTVLRVAESAEVETLD